MRGLVLQSAEAIEIFPRSFSIVMARFIETNTLAFGLVLRPLFLATESRQNTFLVLFGRLASTALSDATAYCGCLLGWL